MRDLLVRGSAWLSFACYLLTLIGWTRRFEPKLLRCLWTLGWGIFVTHVCLAFHLVHHWSHDDAWEATRVLGGVGEGIYFNYLVVIVWQIDLLCWWFWPEGYLARSRWKTRLIQGFLLFMWFNATVVFAHDSTWIVGAAGFVALSYSYLRASGRKPDV
ncbi:MAG TPA: hypothetical protein PLN21_18230 [Gemmatales bacterium]|nr:hypothetical protein [Gemmatales bacterium]